MLVAITHFSAAKLYSKDWRCFTCNLTAATGIFPQSLELAVRYSVIRKERKPGSGNCEGNKTLPKRMVLLFIITIIILF